VSATFEFKDIAIRLNHNTYAKRMGKVHIL
jgi:hypothetical protein